MRTPPLHRALRELGLPLIHWNVRFFDTRRAWTEGRALKSLERTRGGSIILLHDTHEGERRRVFLETLGTYLEYGRSKGMRFEAIGGQWLKG